MNGNEVLFRKEKSVAYVTINREKALNALNAAVMVRLDQIFSDLESEDDVIVAVITGAGQKAFAAGADINEINEAGGERTKLIRKGQEIFSRIRDSRKIVIGAVNGYALGGGCELALACDIRIASDNAKFGFPEATLGLMPGYGGTQLLSRLIGIGKAKYMILTGGIFDAAQAYQLGLVEKVCSRDSFMDEADQLAKKVSSSGPVALKACKRAVNKGVELSLDEGLKLELEEYDKVSRSIDADEGIKAFLEKRTPVFKGR